MLEPRWEELFHILHRRRNSCIWKWMRRKLENGRWEEEKGSLESKKKKQALKDRKWKVRWRKGLFGKVDGMENKNEMPVERRKFTRNDWAKQKLEVEMLEWDEEIENYYD
jgi:hypothetical protein